MLNYPKDTLRELDLEHRSPAKTRDVRQLMTLRECFNAGFEFLMTANVIVGRKEVEPKGKKTNLEIVLVLRSEFRLRFDPLLKIVESTCYDGYKTGTLAVSEDP